jgi:hypothetical protein
MANYGRDFGREAGYQNYGRGYRDSGFGASRENRWLGYGRDYPGYGNEERWGSRGRGTWGWNDDYSLDYGARRRGYGADYKSDFQTRYGDPFHDRERGTPVRMMRGEWGEYDNEFRANRHRDPYGRDYGYRRPGGRY